VAIGNAGPIEQGNDLSNERCSCLNGQHFSTYARSGIGRIRRDEYKLFASYHPFCVIYALHPHQNHENSNNESVCIKCRCSALVVTRPAILDFPAVLPSCTE